MAQQTACRSFTDIKVLWKLRARRSYSSYLHHLTRHSLTLPSANASPTMPVCIPLSYRYRWQLILTWIYLALRALRVLFRTTWAKIRGLLEFYF